MQELVELLPELRVVRDVEAGDQRDEQWLHVDLEAERGLAPFGDEVAEFIDGETGSEEEAALCDVMEVGAQDRPEQET